MSDDDTEQKLLHIKTKRLDALRLQAAEFGPHCPAYIRVEIADLEAEIQETSLQAARIRCTKAHTYLELAEAAFERGDYDSMAGSAIIGLNWVLGKIQEWLMNTGEWTYTEPPDEGWGIENEIPKFYAMFGLRYAEYLRIKGIVGSMVFIPSNQPSIPTYFLKRPAGHPGITSANATLVLRHCLKAILSIEQQVGDIENPFAP